MMAEGKKIITYPRVEVRMARGARYFTAGAAGAMPANA